MKFYVDREQGSHLSASRRLHLNDVISDGVTDKATHGMERQLTHDVSAMALSGTDTDAQFP